MRLACIIHRCKMPQVAQLGRLTVHSDTTPIRVTNDTVLWRGYTLTYIDNTIVFKGTATSRPQPQVSCRAHRRIRSSITA